MRFERRRLLGLSISHAINDGSLAVFLGALPVIRAAFGLSLIEIGTLLSVGLLATVIMQFPFGYLADRSFVRPVLIAGILSIATIDLLFLGAENYWHLLIFYTMLRAAAGVYHPVSFSTIFRSASHRSREMGFQSAFGDASLAFALVSTGFVSESYGWHVPFLAWGAASLIGAVAVSVLTRTRGRTREFEEFQDSATSSGRESTVLAHFAVLQFTTAFLQSIFVVFTGFIPLFLNNVVNLSPGVSALVVALWLAIGVVSSFNAGRFVDLLGGEYRTLRVSFGLTTFTLLLSAALFLIPSLRILALITLVLGGVPYFLAFPVLYGFVGTKAPRRRLGLAYAANLSIGLIIGSVFAYATGYLASFYGLVVVLPILIAIGLAANGSSLLLRE